jgi:polynucleotide 5'-kinase involved in rRNA processing
MIYSDPKWDQLPLLDMKGILMIIGDSDTGKTTFARYLFDKLSVEYPDKKIFFLDGDPGQSILGPPTTITLSNKLVSKNQSHKQKFTRRYFIGSISPRGHMLQMILGTSKLIREIQNNEKTIVIHDTTGLVEPRFGGYALKTALIELLQPSTLFVFQKANELTNLILPHKLSGRLELIELNISDHILSRNREERKKYRQKQYQEYFSKLHNHEIAWDKIAIFPYPDFGIHRIIAFEDQYGFTLGLGIINSIDRKRSSINVMSPISSLKNLNSLRIGDISLNPVTFIDKLVFEYS